MNVSSLDDLTTFARVADMGSLTQAAAALGLTPSAVSRSLARLEERLGARLLHRTTRRVALTEEGAQFHRRVVQLLGDLEEAEAEARGHADAPIGTLRVSTSIAFGTHQLLPLLPDLRRRYPRLRIALDLDDRRVDLVAEGVDVAIRFGALGDSSLIARKIGWTTRIICAAPAYLARNGLPETPDDLSRHDCLVFRDPAIAHLNRWPFRTPAGRREIAVTGPFMLGDGETLYRLALDGLGVARLSRFVADAALRDGRLVPLLASWQIDDQTPLHAVYPHRRHLPPRVSAFVEFLVERFGAKPAWEP
jgi:DNA-binding transcriptional LysR family regulator